jgi:hypothetical protein
LVLHHLNSLARQAGRQSSHSFARTYDHAHLEVLLVVLLLLLLLPPPPLLLLLHLCRLQRCPALLACCSWAIAAHHSPMQAVKVAAVA